MSNGSRPPWEKYLKRIRAISVCVLDALRGNGLRLPALERVDQVTQDLHELLKHNSSYHASTSVWAAIGERHLAGLVAVYGLALRRSVAAAAPSAERETYTALRSSLSAHLRRFNNDFDFVGDELYDQVGKALGLVRSHFCYIAILAGLASELRSAPVSGSGLIGARAYGVVKEAISLLEVWLLPDRELTRLRATLIIGVVKSGFLEHCAQALLLATRCEGTSAEAAALMKRMTPVLAARLLSDWCSRFGISLGNHCLSYLLTSHLVGLAAALDGGATYGMPTGPGVPATPLFTTAGRPLRMHASDLADVRLACLALSEWEMSLAQVVKHVRPQAPGFASSLAKVAARRLPLLRIRLAELEAITDDDIELTDEQMQENRDAQCELDVVELIVSVPTVPPFKVAATWDVAMRLMASTHEALAADAPAVAAGRPTEEEEQQRQRPRVNPDQAPELGLRALSCARVALWNVGWAAAADTPPAKVAQLERWWSLTASFIDLASIPRPGPDGRRDWERVQLGGLLSLRTMEPGPLPPEPSLDVATALRAGYPRLAELLLRRPSGMNSRDPDRYVNGLGELSVEAWGQVLAFGAPVDVASLAASAAKAIRRAALRLESAAVAVRAEFAASGVSDDVSEFSFSCVDGRDRSSTFKILDAERELMKSCDQAKEGVTIASRALNASSTGVAPFVNFLLKTIWLRPGTASAATETAAPGGVPAVEAVAVQPPASSGDCGGAGPTTAATGRDSTEEACTVAAAVSEGAVRAAGAAEEEELADPTGSTVEQATAAGNPALEIGNGAAHENVGTGAERRDGQQSGASRLASGLAQIAVRVLPEVTRLASNLSGSWGMRNQFDEQACGSMLEAALSWLPLLLAAASPPADGTHHALHHGISGQPSTLIEDRIARAENDATTPAARAEASAARRAAAAAWDRFLWLDVRLPELLGLTLRLAEVLCTRPCWINYAKRAWVRSMWVLIATAPERLAHALSGRVGQEGQSFATAGSGSGQHAKHTLGLSRLGDVLGPGGTLPEPELLAALEKVCTGDRAVLAVPQASLAEVERRGWLAAAALLPPPGEVLAVLPTCGNPLCTNLEGDSEAGLKLSGCGRCGGRVRYCSRECQVAHWKAGHKAECGRG